MPDGTPVNAHDAVSGNAALSRIIMLSDKAVFPEHGGVGIKEGNPANTGASEARKGSLCEFSIYNAKITFLFYKDSDGQAQTV